MPDLFTVAPVVESAPNWIPTGNLRISLPAISRLNGGVYRIGALSLKANALLEIVGGEDQVRPFIVPCLEQGGHSIPLKELRWLRLDNWIPQYEAKAGDLRIRGTLYAPLQETGFVYLMEISTEAAERIAFRAGIQGWWEGLEQVIFRNRRLDARLEMWQDPWTGSLVGEASAGQPLLAWGLQPSCEGQLTLEERHFQWMTELLIDRETPAQIAFYFALNMESDGARTSALHLRRVGWQRLLSDTQSWLKAHRQHVEDADAEQALNENLFFNYFFAQGECLDEDELVLVTSRSNQYYVSAAFWARDAFLWSFPALLLVDKVQARRALFSGLSRYRRWGAEHALYLNGRPLYPGFELDEACAPLIALGHYLETTRDWSLIERPEVRATISTWEAALSPHYCPDLGLYETFLTPHDDPTVSPYLTYDNVLVWKAFRVAASIFERLQPGDPHVLDWRCQADELKQAILNHCVCEGPFGKQFVGAIDAQGRFEWTDYAAGSLMLLPHYGFCPEGDVVYLNTRSWIFSKFNPYYYPHGLFPGVGSQHFPYPSSFGLANQLLCHDLRAKRVASKTPMDQGLACKSFDPQTGVVRTGAAFATGAGFFAYALYHAFH